MKTCIQRLVWWCAAALMVAGNCFGQSMRVTGWDMRPAAGDSAARDGFISEAASNLKKSDPDVILLQNVSDWKSCERLVQALKPAKYNLLVCSSFREGANNALGRHQVAVLSKSRAYFSWSQAWRSADDKSLPGGFAFVALKIGNQALGFYSVEVPDESAGSMEPLAQQLQAHAQSVQGWEANKLDATVAMGTPGTPGAGSQSVRDALSTALVEAGFGEIFQAASEATGASSVSTPQALPEFVSTEPPGMVGQPKIFFGSTFQQPTITYDVDLNPAKLVEARTIARERLRAKARVASAQTNSPARPQPAITARPAPAPATPVASAESRSTSNSTPAPASSQRDSRSQSLVFIAIGVALGLAALTWFLVKALRRPPAKEPKLLVDSGAASYTIIVGTQSATRGAPGEAKKPASAGPLIHLDVPGATHTHAQNLQPPMESPDRRSRHEQDAIRAGVIANLSGWLKQKFVRTLLAERSQMLGTQDAAALKTLQVEERLTRIEAQINLQNLGYQQRIDELTKQLIAAKEENRELIRTQIRQVKAEMDAARERMLAQARDADRR